MKSRGICLRRLFVIPSCFSLHPPEVVPSLPFPLPPLLCPQMEGQGSTVFLVSWWGDTGLAQQRGDCSLPPPLISP